MKRILITTLLSSSLLLSNAAVAQQQAPIPPTLLQHDTHLSSIFDIGLGSCQERLRATL